MILYVRDNAGVLFITSIPVEKLPIYVKDNVRIIIADYASSSDKASIQVEELAKARLSGFLEYPVTINGITFPKGTPIQFDIIRSNLTSERVSNLPVLIQLQSLSYILISESLANNGIIKIEEFLHTIKSKQLKLVPMITGVSRYE